MNLQSMPIVGLGLIFVGTAAAVLLLQVQNELGAAGGLSRRGRLLLAVGMGLGIFAFAFKLIAMWVFESHPEASIRPLLAWDFFTPAHVSTPWTASRNEDAGPSLYTWQALPTVAPAPEDNPVTAARVALGQRLFNDKSLSRDGSLACASCHDIEREGGADGRRVALGIDQAEGNRNSPTVWNAAFQSSLFWDGRAASLEEQAKGPLVNPKEMGMPSLAAVVERVRRDPAYRAAFAAAYGPDARIDIDLVAKAIASYERTLITPDTRYDDFVRGDRAALTERELRGMALFEKTGCVACHSGPNFSGASLLAPGINLAVFPALDSRYRERFRLTDDTGRAAAGSPAGIWRVPSLRNVALTAPYFHNGAVEKLEDAVRIMAAVQLGRESEGRRSVYWSENDKVVSTVECSPLNDRDIADIAAFLQTLSSRRLLDIRGRS